MKKKLIDKKRFLTRVIEAHELGFFDEDETDFIIYMIRAYEDLELNARRYKTYKEMIGRLYKPEERKEEIEKIDKAIDEELKKKV